MSDKYKFTLDNFKKWMKDQPTNDHSINRIPTKNKDLIGVCVESKIELKKLISKMKSDDDLKEVAQLFIEEGGVICGTEGKVFTIKTSLGKFTIPRYYVRRS